ncbi:glucose dehydrogenase [FAD, quinone] [Musca domestica]|uniref:Glucose dehydrogenase [FAD, quinone] n=1 Tax=Musca domestica TaxID=7370 RepID=A0A9J7CI54_MUSDO|nr:glucose dehydrogenase [FAD, quinone] [Musca domestica]
MSLLGIAAATTTTPNVCSAQCSVTSLGAMQFFVSLLVESLFKDQCAISTKDNWPQDYAEEVTNSDMGTFDFVIIGGGSAGSVVAGRLSENPLWRTLVLEAGTDPPLESEVPFLFTSVQSSNYTYSYRGITNGVSCKSAAGGNCGWLSGKCLGGSGAINAMLYFRGTRGDYDGWCGAGCEGWCYEDVWPYFRKSFENRGNETHPSGYMKLGEYGNYGEDIKSLFFSGAKELGLRKIRDFVEGSYVGYGNFRGILEEGRRISSAKGFLGRVAKYRENLKVMKNARVTQLLFNKKADRVTEIEFLLQNRKTLKVKVQKEVILSAGTVESPKLLMLSGVGPKDVLKPLNIPVRHNLPIGENLQDHVAVPIFFAIPNENPSTSPDLDEIYAYLKYQKGFLASIGTGSLNGFIKTNSNPKDPYPDIQLQHFTVRRGAPLGMGFLQGFMANEKLTKYFENLVQQADVVVVFILLLQPKSRGKIQLKSSQPEDPLLIYPNYLQRREDVDGLMAGIEYLQRLAKTSIFKSKKAKLMRIPIEECLGDAENFWPCYISYYSSTSSHLVGTIKMGADSDTTACVGPRLKVKGVRNLRVADASIMPTITSCNTYGPTLMIGERAAEFIQREWRGK